MKPILVIADDLTGAAEIGGLALRYGLSSQIVHTLKGDFDTAIVILNTDSRSLKIDKALSHLGALFPPQAKSDWEWVYLKFDSALRGHIKQEIPFYKEIFGDNRVFFCPVNPKLDRVIQEGKYLVNGIPIAETDFANDPEFPIRRSSILELLGSTVWQLSDQLSDVGDDDVYIIPHVSDAEGLQYWGRQVLEKTLFAGAAAFFEELLRNHIDEKKPLVFNVENRQGNRVYICGSKHEESVERVKSLSTAHVIYWHKPGGEWNIAGQMKDILMKQQTLVFAIASDVASEARVIRKSMATSIAMLREQCVLSELIIEGGATARAVLKALHIDALCPKREFGPGVIQCEVPGQELWITMKPGSYNWTKELWVF
ncbi:four-carbon acid sugar kinase family protein [Sphingobacterium sp. LRF_L2]|uniref:four-carbon acid sugar kinase family protein n=1 Tax=Sphingobacterium sp. LRF_L2 TaxID=3369421 RepID=UPI003F623CCC